MKKSLLAIVLSCVFLFTGCENSYKPMDSIGDLFPGTGQTSDSSDIGNSDKDSTSSSEEEDSDKDSTSSSGEEDSDKDSTGGENAPNEEEKPPVSEQKDCVDKDDNGYCDTCNEPVTVTIDIFAVNDLHGKFDDTDSQPGVDELTTYLRNAKANNKNSIFLSSGDMWQGSSESNLTHGRLLTDWMNEMDFLSMTLGNHEFDWGESYIESNSEFAEFPFLAINIYDRDTGEQVEYCQSSVTIELDGAKIGVIGAIGDCYSSIASDKVTDIYFKTGSELTALVKAESQKLRDEGADFIIYSLHDGNEATSSSTVTGNLSYYDTSLSNGYVDLVLEGHTHQRYVFKDSYGVYHLQGGGDNDGITTAQLTVNFAGGSSKVNSAKYIATSTYSSLSGDALVDTLLEKYAEEIALAGKVLGTNSKYRKSGELCDVVAELYYKKGIETWGAEYDVVLGGGFLQARSPYNLNAGQVTYGDLQMIFPFDNQIVLCSISGYYLRTKFFETTNSSYHIYYESYGESIKANINNNQTYYVITDTYTSAYASNRLTEVARLDETTFARDLLADYIEAGGFGTATETITLTSIPDLIAIGNSLASNQTTETQYFVKGEIISITNATYGNLTIRDEDGNTLYVYGVYDLSGGRYDGISPVPKVGDTVLLQGPIQKYVYNGNATIELYHATLWSIE